MNVQLHKQRLFDYFDGKATAIEIKQIEVWASHPANEELFYDWLDEWEKLHLQYQADHHTSLIEYHDFLYSKHPYASTKKNGRESVKLPVSRFLRWPWVWASVAMIAVILGVFVFRDQVFFKTHSTGYGNTLDFTLSDGSSVTLNANSSLKVPRFGFGSRTRKVELKGEALFSVEHKESNQKFIVKTLNSAEVIVLGTEFTVWARESGMNVTLRKGKVTLRYQNQQSTTSQVVMKPGSTVTLSKEGQLARKPANPIELDPGWPEHQFKFDRTPLTEIATMLFDTYGLTIEIQDKEAGDLTLSGNFPAKDGKELLKIVAEVLNMNVRHQGSKYVLTLRSAH